MVALVVRGARRPAIRQSELSGKYCRNRPLRCRQAPAEAWLIVVAYGMGAAGAGGALLVTIIAGGRFSPTTKGSLFAWWIPNI
jgi:hypothetical protein